jgi:hypothetical protein
MRVASHFRCSVAELQQRMNGKELAQWTAWMDAEQIGPEWDRFRHAQMLAAVQNGGRYEHAEKRAFIAKDFMTPDPWTEPEEPKPTDKTAALRKRLLAAELSAMEDAFAGE